MRAFTIMFNAPGRSYLTRVTVVAEDRKSCPAFQESEWKKDDPAEFGFDAEGRIIFKGKLLEGAMANPRELPAWAQEKEKVDAGS